MVECLSAVELMEVNQYFTGLHNVYHDFYLEETYILAQNVVLC
jgi:hypothetical protein